MNIIDALLSCKRFKRNDHSYWSSHDKIKDHIDCNGTKAVKLYPSDILADDWEIEEEARPITLSQINMFYADVAMYAQFPNGYHNHPLSVWKKKLGFEESYEKIEE